MFTVQFMVSFVKYYIYIKVHNGKAKKNCAIHPYSEYISFS